MKTNNKEFYIVEKAFQIVQKKGWEKFSLQDLSKEKIKESEINSYFKNKNEIIDKFSYMIDSFVESKINLNDFKISSKKETLLIDKNGLSDTWKYSRKKLKID